MSDILSIPLKLVVFRKPNPLVMTANLKRLKGLTVYLGHHRLAQKEASY